MTEKKWTKPLFYLSTFFVPLIMLLLLYMAYGIYPFGDKSVLISDMNTQYVYFMAAFRDILLGKESFLYSFHLGLGGNALSLVAYYLASIYNVILVLFPKDMVQDAMAIIILLKVGSLGLSSAYFFRKERKSSFLVVLVFSTSYALMGYVIIYTMHIMWLDCLIYLPLIAAEVSVLTEKRKNLRLVVYLVLCLLSNFYIAYMVCIFTPIWLGYKMIVTKPECGLKEVLKKIRDLLLHGILAASIAAFLLLPTIISLLTGNGTTLNDNNIDYTFTDVIRGLYLGVYGTIKPGGIPNIYVGVFALILIGFYFFHSQISRKEKFYSIAVMLFFYASVQNKLLYLAWHGFDAPTWFESRFSFLFCFFILYLAYRIVDKLEWNPKMLPIMIGECVLFTLGIWLNRYEFTIFQALLNAGFFIAYQAILWISLEKKINMNAVIVSVVIVELMFNGYLSNTSMQLQAPYHGRDEYLEEMAKSQDTIDDLEEQDTSVYRMEKYFDYHDNDALSQNYMGLSMFSTIYYPDTNDTLVQLGTDATARQSSFVGTTVFTDSLFGIKYLLSLNKETSFGRDYQLLDGIYVFKNPYALDLFTSVDDSIMDIDPITYSNPFSLQNKLIQTIYGTFDVIFTPKKYMVSYHNVEVYMNTESKIGYKKISSNKDAYVEFTMNKEDSEFLYSYIKTYLGKAEVKINHMPVSEFLGTVNDIGNIDGYLADDSKIKVQLYLEADKLIIRSNPFYSFDTTLFDEVAEDLESSVDYTTFTNTKIEFNTTISSDNKIIMTSIPYDKGWSIWVNGEKVETQKVLNGFIAIPVSSGENVVKMVYCPVGFKTGIGISVTGLLIFLYVIFRKRKKKQENIKREAME